MRPTMKPSKLARNEQRLSSIYSRGLITRNIVLPMTAVSKNIKEVLETNISSLYEGKCITEGYVKSESAKIVTFSSGTVVHGTKVSFVVVFECEICYPVEGILISCVAQNITKVGIKAASADENPSPIVVFIARDHNYNNTQFTDVNVGDKFNVRVIGQRFELNDKYISIIAELVKPKTFKEAKPKLVIGI